MPKQSAEPGRYLITPEHFALERAELAKKRELKLVDHAQELEEIDREFEKLYRLEADIAALAERHAKSPKKKIVIVGKAKGKRATPSRQVPSGKPWTPEEDARVLAADAAVLADIAAERNTKITAIQKRRSILRRAAQVEESVGSEPIEESAQLEPSSSENPEIVEPTPVPAPAKPGTLTGRLMDNGPGDRRMYGRGFESENRE